MKKVIALSVVATGLLFANGYKIPEQSLSGMALSAANVANAHGADANYYNPANMVFNEDKNSYEFLLTYIHLPKVTFEDKTNNAKYSSKSENFLIPQFHFTSKDYDGWRWGFSLTAPAGLSKEWDDAIPKASAKEFTLKTYELNPTIAKKINDNLSIAFGVRAVKSKGVVQFEKTGLYSLYLTGDSIDYGWNAALTYKFDDTLKTAVTYRSKVDLTIKGDADGFYSKYLLTHNVADLTTLTSFNTSAKVSIPIPAALNIAVAKTFNKTTVELVFERTFWSSYKNLDFDYDNAIIEANFGQAKPKDWKDVNTYRIGLTHQCTEKLTAMLGYSYDNTPVPDSTVDFSLPDSDKHIFSGGIKFKMSDRMSLGFSALYAKQKERSATVGTSTGTFKDGGAFLMAFGMDYSF